MLCYLALCSLLALVSYNFTSGPWKTLWVKLGYDPRSTTASKVYQCIDYRMPKDITMIETRRSRQKSKAGMHVVHMHGTEVKA